MKNGLKNIEAIEIVSRLNSSMCNFENYFYSGDSDTHIEAFDEVVKRHNIEEYYNLSVEDRVKYSKIYESEIMIEFNKLVKLGKDLEEFCIKFNDRLSLLKKNEEKNL